MRFDGATLTGVSVSTLLREVHDGVRDGCSMLADRLDRLQALVAPGSEHDTSWQSSAIGDAGLG